MRSSALLLGLVIALAGAQVAFAQDEEAPFSIQGLSEREQAIFLEATGQALTLYNLKLRLHEHPRLYCPPENLNLDGQTVWTLANSLLTGPHKPGIVAIAVVDQLTKKFPCGVKSKEEIERESLDETLRLTAEIMSRVDETTKKRYADCLQSTSSAAFCDCLNEKLGWQTGFAAYERVAFLSNSELGYESLSSDDRNLVDHIHSIRDECTSVRHEP